MSDMLVLAAALDRHTKALETCAAALSNGEGATKTRTTRAKTAADQPAQEPAAVPAATPAPATPAAMPAVVAAAAPASAASAAIGTGPSLQKVADAIIDLANTVSREAAVSILTKYGAQKVPQLKAPDFLAVLADVAAAKAGTSTGAAGGLM